DLHVNIVDQGHPEDLAHQGKLLAQAQNDVRINQTDGSLYVSDVVSTAGNVSLTAAGFLFNAGPVIDPANIHSGYATTAPASNQKAIVTGNSITLSAGIGIGDAVRTFNIISAKHAAGTLDATSGIDNIYIHQVEGDVSLNSISAAGHIAFITSNL